MNSAETAAYCNRVVLFFNSRNVTRNVLLTLFSWLSASISCLSLSVSLLFSPHSASRLDTLAWDSSSWPSSDDILSFCVDLSSYRHDEDLGKCISTCSRFAYCSVKNVFIMPARDEFCAEQYTVLQNVNICTISRINSKHTNTNTNSDLYSAAYKLSRGANKMSKSNMK